MAQQMPLPGASESTDYCLLRLCSAALQSKEALPSQVHYYEF